jgi:hypothetical protein
MNLLQKSDYIQIIRMDEMYIVLQNYLTGQHSQLMLSAPKLIVSNNNINNTINNKNGNCP